jgi:hypothetical protein
MPAVAAPHICLSATADALGVNRTPRAAAHRSRAAPRHPVAEQVFYARANVAKLAASMREVEEVGK